ncbi:MAG: ybeZ [Francisellaceae bacterium]|nr:ybeZ [Francisellaceae bacterium]
MNDENPTLEITLMPYDNRRIINLCGRFDEHLRQIEKGLGVEIINRGNIFYIKGQALNNETAMLILQTLYKETHSHKEITPSQVQALLQHCLSSSDKGNTTILNPNKTSIKTRQSEIKARNENQQLYLKNMQTNVISFGVGPAGTGKTYLAVAAAVAALEQERIKRILLVRPVVEAGEHLGFLPGDLSQKIDPYLRPLYDALYEMLGTERVVKLIERQIIEIAPLAYMRGRTLNDAFIILDESQNTTIEQMKMFLTRIGFNSTALITGDITQIDLPRNKKSGLKQAIEILQDIPNISFTFFNNKDVVRHPIVQKIVEAYENYEAKFTPHSKDKNDEY